MLQNVVRDDFYSGLSKEILSKDQTISVEKLISIVKAQEGEITPELLQKMMLNLVLSPESIVFVPEKGENDYTYQSFVRTENLEMLLCRFNSGDMTDLHCHKKNLAGVKILKGKVTSHKYHWGIRDNRPIITDGIKSTTLTTGSVDIINTDEAHQLICEEPTISLHIYIKPLIQICIYDPFSGKGSDHIFRCRM